MGMRSMHSPFFFEEVENAEHLSKKDHGIALVGRTRAADPFDACNGLCTLWKQRGDDCSR